MSSFIISFMFGAGVGTFAWAQLAKGTGNADPSKVVMGAGAAGLVAFLFFFSLLKWIIHLN